MENDPFQCHPYMIENGDETILIDPGSVIQKDKLVNKIQEVCDLKSIKYIILHHQDPDLCAAVPELEKLIDRDDLTIVTHSRMSVLIKHYGLKSGYYNIDHNEFILNAGDISLNFLTTPYCHSPGAFVTYEKNEKVLFSGDLFGGLEDSWHFYADTTYFTYIEGFHISYMPSRDILNYALRKIEKYDIDLIAPQHGSIIKRELIADLIDRMKEMECGLYIDKEYTENLSSTIDQLQIVKNELQVSFDEVSAMKQQQDGDYFLMNLLANPLMQNNNSSSKIKTDFIIYQKKRFLFKNTIKEIGGDFCYSNNLTFNGEPHTIFINGDSMGKSVQGAGGLLVTGTAIIAIMNRFQDDTTDITPEEWILTVYSELHKLLLSFDGSMMVSVVLGCVNENTGLLSYINAEHPFPVLLHNNRAQFIDEDIQLRKIGCTEQLLPDVRTYQLEPGDVLFIGSDGKDDLRMVHENGKNTINDDPDIFRLNVEKSNGSMKEVVSNIVMTGELTDDLSLLRISYMEKKDQAPCNCTELINNLDSMRIKKFIQAKRYQDALEILEIQPQGSAEIFYLQGLCHYHLKRYLKAREGLMEALSIAPSHLATLKLLGNIHIHFTDYTEAASVWEKALDIDPQNTKLKEKYDKVLTRVQKQRILLGVKQNKQ